jgi:hypothetical protein
VYICPAGQQLKHRTIHKNRNQIEYKAPKKVCAACELRDQCTQSKTGRTVMRHLRQEELDEMISKASSPKSRHDLKRRQHLCEGSFGNSIRYGYKRARWRRLWRLKIQDYLTCALQNILKLAQHHKDRRAIALLAAPERAFRPVVVFFSLLVPHYLFWGVTLAKKGSKILSASIQRLMNESRTRNRFWATGPGCLTPLFFKKFRCIHPISLAKASFNRFHHFIF